MAEELPLEQGIPDVDDPATGFLWDNLARRGLTYRIYGEFIAAVWCKSDKTNSSKKGTPSPSSASCPVAEINKGEPLPPNVGNPRGGPSPWSSKARSRPRRRRRTAPSTLFPVPSFPRKTTATPGLRAANTQLSGITTRDQDPHPTRVNVRIIDDAIAIAAGTTHA